MPEQSKYKMMRENTLKNLLTENCRKNRNKQMCMNLIPAPLAGGKVSRKARTVNAFINTLFLVCENNPEELIYR